jgi:hypothetical protein
VVATHVRGALPAACGGRARRVLAQRSRASHTSGGLRVRAARSQSPLVVSSLTWPFFHSSLLRLPPFLPILSSPLLCCSARALESRQSRRGRAWVLAQSSREAEK